MGRISSYIHAAAAAAAGQPSGGGEFDFSTLGLTSDLDARAGVSTTGAGVSDWQDQGSANLDATQTTDADRPAAGATVNGFDAIDFDTSNGEFLNWALTTASAGTIFVVGQVGAAPDNASDVIIGSGAGGPTGDAGVSIQAHTDTTLRIRMSDSASRVVATGSTVAGGALFIVGIRWSATQMGIRINGGAEATNTPPGGGSGSFGSVAFDIGKNATTTSAHWDGAITRILAAPTTRLNDTNFAAAFTELNNIYGIY